MPVDKERIRYKEDPKRYLSVLEMGIEIYKLRSSYCFQGAVTSISLTFSIIVAILGGLMASLFYQSILSVAIKFWTLAVKYFPIFSGDIEVFIIQFLAWLMFIAFFLLVIYFSFWIGSAIGNKLSKKTKIPERVFRDEIDQFEDTKEMISKLDALFLAKLEPEKWNLKVIIDREINLIKDIEIEKAKPKVSLREY